MVITYMTVTMKTVVICALQITQRSTILVGTTQAVRTTLSVMTLRSLMITLSHRKMELCLLKTKYLLCHFGSGGKLVQLYCLGITHNLDYLLF